MLLRLASRLLFLRVRPLVALSARRALVVGDLEPLDAQPLDARAAARFLGAFQRSRSLWRAIWSCERRAVALSGLLSLLAVCVSSCAPLLLFKLLNSVMSEPQDAQGDPRLLLLLLYVNGVVGSVLNEQAQAVISTATTRVTVGIRSLLFQDALSRPVVRAHGMQTAVASIATLYSSSVPSVGLAMDRVHKVWMAAFQLVVLLLLLHGALGVSVAVMACCLTGVCVVLVVLALAASHCVHSCAKKRQRTLAAVAEGIKSIQAVKLQAWEKKMLSKMTYARVKEEKKLYTLLAVRCVLYCTIWESPGIVSVVILSSLAKSEEGLSPASAFTALVLFDRIQSQLYGFIHALRLILDGRKALRKMDKYLQTHHEIPIPSVDRTPVDVSDTTTVIRIEQAVFSEPRDPLDVILVNVNLKVRKGELVVIHGPAGAGKSTLMNALLGEAHRLRGRVFVSETCRIAHCSHEAWLQSLSIRDNILFGLSFDKTRYSRVLEACCLLEDLKTFASGDSTIVGPRGINLSGGQRARVALARAIYADADLYLLDAPLSTSDAIVQSDMFRKCFLEILKHKTVVVTTHNPEIISSEFADRTWFVDELRVVQSIKDPRAQTSRRVRRLTSIPPWRSQSQSQSSGQQAELEYSVNASYVAPGYTLESYVNSSHTDISQDVYPQDKAAFDIQATERTISKADAARLLSRSSALKRAIPRILILMTLYGIMLLGRNVWFVYWSNLPPTSSNWTQIAVYGALIASGFAALLPATFAVFFGIADTVGVMFREATRSLMFAPMSTFYHAKIGDILTKSSIGIHVAESVMAYPVVLLLRSTASLLSSLISVCYVLGGSIGIPCAAFAGYVAHNSLKDEERVVTQIQALRSTVDSDILTFVSESLDGGSIIRAGGPSQVKRFKLHHHNLVQSRERTVSVMMAWLSWMRVRTHLCMGVSYALLGALLTTSPSIEGGYSISSSALGFVVYTVIATQRDLSMLSYVVLKISANLDNIRNLFEVQRIQVEDGHDQVRDASGVSDQGCDATVLAKKSWPNAGDIVFEDVWFRYESGLRSIINPKAGVASPFALRGVSFRIDAGEKIGVVGRTGSGKSSLSMALFRIHELSHGRIIVNGRDISRLPLHSLRSSLRVIPQSPLFYRCSVRGYLDPFDEFDDASVWRVLRRVGLALGDGEDSDGSLAGAGDRVVVRDLKKKLSENGSNWSAGERQMLALARALLSPSRVLILDEAFSSLDQTRDKELLEVVDAEFSKSTIFLMTHRLDQVLGLDRIMVMRSGQVVEMGTAEELVSNPESAFYEFLESTLLTF